MTRRNLLIAATALSLATTAAPLHAQNATVQQTTTVTVTAEQQQGKDVQIATTSAEQGTAVAPKTVEDKWQEWLVGHGFTEGVKIMPDGRTIVLTSGSAVVRADPGDAKWLAARNAAFNMAELDAKKSLAEFIGTEMRSGRGVSLATQGGETPPPMMAEPVRQLSIAEKAKTLTGKSLDDAIRNYDPNFNGTNVSDDQKRAEIITLQEKIKDHIASQARLFTSGAFIITEFEGPNMDGKYAVQIGMIWSSRLGKIAEAVYNPSIRVDPQDPEPPLAVQLDALTKQNPQWMATANGVRVWTNEKGQRVVIAFGSAPGTSSPSIDRDRATMTARAAIQRFVGEQVETAAESKSDFAYQESASGAKSFDESSYQRNIDAVAKTMTISGSTQVGQWRDKHPSGNVLMQTVVVAWTPDSYATAKALGGQMEQQEQNMRRQGGAMPVSGPVQPSGGVGNAPVAAPVLQGPSSNPSKF